ncbi:unnamed protein product [Caretta caretta]
MTYYTEDLDQNVLEGYSETNRKENCPASRNQKSTFLVSSLKDEVLKITSVQKQTRAGQHTRFKAFVAIGYYNGHVSHGVKCSKEVTTAIRGAILAKLSIVPVRRGYWGNKIGKPHTVPCKTYSYLTPDLWKETVFTKSPYQEFTGYLAKTHTRVSVQRTQATAVAT